MTKALVITCSDAASRGDRVDGSGPAVRARLRDAGFDVAEVVVVPDEIEAIASRIRQAIDEESFTLVVTTGGTGISPRDVTPEATNRVAEKRLDGFGERMRAASLEKTPMAPLSRAQAVTRGSALIVNLPGSPRAAVENLEAIIELIPHALELLSGKRIENHPKSS